MDADRLHGVLRELVGLGGIERANAVGIKPTEQLHFVSIAQVDLFSGAGGLD